MLSQKRKGYRSAGARYALPLLLVVLTVGGWACAAYATPTLDVYDINRDLSGTGTIFIWAVGNGDEKLASSLLTISAQSAVSRYCKNSKVLACFASNSLSDWSGSQEITFLYRYSHGATATYAVSWKNGEGATWIVLDEIQENGEWRINGWRGLISRPNYSGDLDQLNGLFDGTDSTNLFPPTK